MTGLPHLYPRPDSAAELVHAQAWSAVEYALEGYRTAASAADRAYFRKLLLHEIAAFKRREAP